MSDPAPRRFRMARTAARRAPARVVAPTGALAIAVALVLSSAFTSVPAVGPAAAAAQAAPTVAAQPAPVASRRAVRSLAVDVGAQDPAVSPDGESIAASIFGEIFLVPIDGGRAERVSSGLGWDTDPAWSPDGRFLAWAHRLPGETYIVLKDVAGGTTRYAHRAEEGVGPIAFHPNGDELFFVLDRNQYDAHVWRVPLDGGDEAEPVTATENWHEWSFAFSPGDGGERLLVESGRYGGADLYTIELDDFQVERLTRTPAVNEFGVDWAPDGRRVYIAQRNGVDRLMVEPADGGEAREIFRSPYSEKTLDLTPDGSAAIVADARRLVRVDLATGEARPIPFTAEFTVADRGPGDLVINNARVFTGTDDDYIENATVVVRDGRIDRVEAGGGPMAFERTPSSDTGDRPVIDARGRVVMAGLMDNHYHYWSPFAGDRLLAGGVTTVRDPGASVASSMTFKDANAMGLMPGPRIFSAGPLIDGLEGYHPAVDVALEDPEAADALVRALHDQGVDLLKVYFHLEPDVAAAVIDAARDVGIPVTGHIGVRTSWGEAIDAGIDGFNHIRVWRDFLPPGLQVDGRDESLDGRKFPMRRMQGDWTRIDPDGPDVGALLERMAENGVAMDPTLRIQRPSERDRERFGLEDYQIVRDGYEKMERFVVRAHEMGVPILAGTDNIGLVNELEAYQDAGMPNADILRAATVNGARWLGRDDEFGTVEPGMRADLILVDGDPLEDVGDLREIRYVIQEGRIVVRNEYIAGDSDSDSDGDDGDDGEDGGGGAS
ncbi:MAG: amidohydrolase family protein [Gemmatimonadota bacterium]